MAASDPFKEADTEAGLRFLAALRAGHRHLSDIARESGLRIDNAAEVLSRGLAANRLQLTGNRNVIEEASVAPPHAS